MLLDNYIEEPTSIHLSGFHASQDRSLGEILTLICMTLNLKVGNDVKFRAH